METRKRDIDEKIKGENQGGGGKKNLEVKRAGVWTSAK